MSKSVIHESGPAFPIVNDHEVYSLGISVRDWFAGQALAGMMAQSHDGPKDWTRMGHGWGEDTANHLNKHEAHVALSVADFAYQIADAMLKAREAQP